MSFVENVATLWRYLSVPETLELTPAIRAMNTMMCLIYKIYPVVWYVVFIALYMILGCYRYRLIVSYSRIW